MDFTNEGDIQGDIIVNQNSNCGSGGSGTGGSGLGINNRSCISSNWSACENGKQTRQIILEKLGDGSDCGPLERTCTTDMDGSGDTQGSSASPASGLFSTKNIAIGGSIIFILFGLYYVFSSKPTPTSTPIPQVIKK